MLLYRVLSAIIAIPILLAIIYVGGALFAVAVALILLVATSEIHIHSRFYHRPLAIISALLAAAFGFIPFLQPSPIVWSLLVTLAVVIPLIWTMLFFDVTTSLEGWTVALGSIVYVGILGGHLTALREGPQGLQLVLLAVVVTWLTDTGAYVVGKLFGTHKLAPKISPGKTIEGAIGGFIVGAAATFGLSEVLNIELGMPVLIALAVLLPVLGQIGDLVESMIKRSLNIKDSGSLVPGHGGFLDRIDSILFTTVTTFYLTRLQ